jgi:hypothetical protein
MSFKEKFDSIHSRLKETTCRISTEGYTVPMWKNEVLEPEYEYSISTVFATLVYLRRHPKSSQFSHVWKRHLFQEQSMNLKTDFLFYAVALHSKNKKRLALILQPLDADVFFSRFNWSTKDEHPSDDDDSNDEDGLSELPIYQDEQGNHWF